MSGSQGTWHEYPLPHCTGMKYAISKAIDTIDSVSPCVRVEVWCDGRYIREVP